MLGTTVDRTKLQALATEQAKDIKTEAYLNALSRELHKLTVETALNAELTEHQGYEKYGDSVSDSDDSMSEDENEDIDVQL